MHTVNNDLYNEVAIKDAEKRTDRFKSKQQRERITKILTQILFNIINVVLPSLCSFK